MINQFKTLNTINENETTLMYPSMIKDDRISLVNEDMYKKATRNHFERKYNVENKENSSNKINSSKALQLPVLGAVLNNSERNFNTGTDSPKFNFSKEDNIEGGLYVNNTNDLNLTFKNSKKNLELIKNNASQNNLIYNNSNTKINSNKVYEELYQKIEQLSKVNENLDQKNFDLKGRLLEKTNEFKKVINSSEGVSEEYSKLNAKHNALLIYASDIQKKVDYLEIEITDKTREIEKYNSSDWGKLLVEKENLIRILQNELNLYKTEIHKIKTNLLSNQQGGYVNDITKRIDSLLETYMNENKKYKKILEEYKLRENECSRKWNELLKENTLNIEKINLLHQQLNDQTGHFNNIISDYDKRVAETLNKIPKFLDQFDSKKSEAAQYLVEQTNLIMEEKRRLIEDNSSCENKIEFLNFEIEKLKNEITNLMIYFDNYNNQDMFNSINSNPANNNFNSNSIINGNFNIKSLKIKIEELEDLLTQYKNTNSPNKIIEMEEQILSLNQRLLVKDKQLEALNNKLKDYLKKTNILFDEREAINSLSNSMREKDIIIINLKNQMRDMRDIEKVKNYELDNLSRILDKQQDHSIINFNFNFNF